MIIPSVSLAVTSVTSPRHLKKRLESAVGWFTNNHIIANPDKFQAIMMAKRRENQTVPNIKICNKDIETTKSVNLLD